MGMFGTSGDQVRSKAEKNWSRLVNRDGLALHLRRLHPEKTAVHVAALTQLPPDTVKKWLSGQAAPNGQALLVLACTYGPELMAAMLTSRPDWLDAAVTRQRQDALEAQLAALEAQLGLPARAASGAAFAGVPA